MRKIIILSPEDIVAENFRLTGMECDVERRKLVKGCYSSFSYYETLEEQIASIVGSLVKDHFFIDGNKRTALSTYLVLSQVNKLKHIESDEQLVNTFVEIAGSHKTTEECAKMLFPDREDLFG